MLLSRAMEGLLDYIRIFNDDDAKLFEAKCLEVGRIKIYQNIRTVESSKCAICFKNCRTRGDYCGECSAMLYVQDLKKGREIIESDERVEEYKNWKAVYDNREKVRKEFFSYFFHHKMKLLYYVEPAESHSSDDDSTLNLKKLQRRLLAGDIYENAYANTESETQWRHVWFDMYTDLDGADMIELTKWCIENKKTCGILLCLAAIHKTEEKENVAGYVKILVEATKFNVSEPYLLLGNHYCEDDDELAIVNYRKAAELGNSEAMYWLAQFDLEGGKEELLLRSARGGHFRAYGELDSGEIKKILEERRGECKDEFERWLSLLRNSDEDEAKEKIGEVLLNIKN
ncbi:MAG: hypothetical protein Hyperionvirus6_37 [Hyperionvirus sp.]|uniref:Sel1 repeat family protein n=1 Tax=Hyperionvirus sp. TaxID=2487770 RepID=A0A3G5A7W7_9VIRU|nr:MAG: hypothetical protein Hyperionvirus6_37 [Hyperionvirus sp.]